MAEPLIEVSGLVNRFGSQVVHDHLDMTVEQGEVFGIVGGSGCRRRFAEAVYDPLRWCSPTRPSGG